MLGDRDSLGKVGYACKRGALEPVVNVCLKYR